RIPRQKAAHAELIIDLVPNLLSAEIAEPGRQFARIHPERNAGDEVQPLALVLPVIGRRVTHFGIAVDDRIESLQGGYEFTPGIDLDRHASIGCRGDLVGEALCTDADAGQILRPGCGHAPRNVPLRDRRSGKSSGSDASNAGRLDEGSAV